jgi:hypothetical protein
MSLITIWVEEYLSNVIMYHCQNIQDIWIDFIVKVIVYEGNKSPNAFHGKAAGIATNKP